MSKITITEAAKLLSEKTHSICSDCDDISTLKKTLALAFPKDKEGIDYDFNDDEENSYYGYDRKNHNIWANVGGYLENLTVIKLSDIVVYETVFDNDGQVKRAAPQISFTPVISTSESFDEVIENTLEQIKEKLLVKGKEYRRNNNPYHNFETGARKKNISREKALDGMLLKHEISIEDMTNDLDNGILPTIEAVNEKFDDNIIYLLIKKAMMIDRIENKN